MAHYQQIRVLIDRVRARWRALCALQAMMRGTLIAAVVLAMAVIASRWTAGAPLLLIGLAGGPRAAAAHRARRRRRHRGRRSPHRLPVAAAPRPAGRESRALHRGAGAVA